MTTDIRPTITSDPFSKTIKEVVHLYFEPLQWLRTAASRIIAEIDEGLFPGRKQMESSEVRPSVADSAAKKAEVAAGIRESGNEGSYQADSVFLPDELRTYMRQASGKTDEIASVVEGVKQQLAAQNEMIRRNADLLESTMSAVMARLALTSIAPTETASLATRDEWRTNMFRMFNDLYERYSARRRAEVFFPEDLNILIREPEASARKRAIEVVRSLSPEGSVHFIFDDIDEVSDLPLQKRPGYMEYDARRLYREWLARKWSERRRRTSEAQLIEDVKKLVARGSKSEKKQS